ncbi:MAG: FkbM family methyltransferase, partial [Opitutaceae bacterium]
AVAKSNYVTLLEHFGIDVILDVGAHEGLSARKTFDHGYRGRIISFEPLAKHFGKLNEACAQARQKGYAWEARHQGLGDQDATLPINVAGNGESSSLVAMLPEHEKLNPTSKYLGQEAISVVRLDTIFDQLRLTTKNRVLLQLDVQGFEPQALEGACLSLPKITGVQLEVNFRPAYATGYDVPTAFQSMEKLGFTPCYVEPAWGDEKTWVFYQVDVLWFRVA